MKTRNFGRHFSRKNLGGGSSISGNPYIIAFLNVVSTEIPGNSKKGGVPILTKTVNFGGLGKV